MFSNKQVDQQDLAKLGIEVNMPQEKRNLLQDRFGHGLVFNIISQKVESYAKGAIALNHKFLIPIYAKGNGLVQINWNDQPYLVTMNDRQMMKLLELHDDLSIGMHPLIMKKYADYYVISYKALNLSTDEFGAVDFIESLDEYSKFIPQPEKA